MKYYSRKLIKTLMDELDFVPIKETLERAKKKWSSQDKLNKKISTKNNQ